MVVKSVKLSTGSQCQCRVHCNNCDVFCTFESKINFVNKRTRFCLVELIIFVDLKCFQTQALLLRPGFWVLKMRNLGFGFVVTVKMSKEQVTSVNCTILQCLPSSARGSDLKAQWSVPPWSRQTVNGVSYARFVHLKTHSPFTFQSEKTRVFKADRCPHYPGLFGFGKHGLETVAASVWRGDTMIGHSTRSRELAGPVLWGGGLIEL